MEISIEHALAMQAILRQESSFERKAPTFSENVIQVKVANVSWYAVVRFSRARSEQFDFFRAQCYKYSPSCGDCWQQQADSPVARLPTLKDSVQITIDSQQRVARFGPLGNIVMSEELRSLGIGSYLMAQVVLWAKQNYPDCLVLPGTLARGDAATPESLLRRNRFYKNQGFDFCWKDAEVEGAFYKAHIDQLSGKWDRGKIRALSIQNILDIETIQGKSIEKLQRSLSLKDSQLKARERKIRLLSVCLVFFVMTVLIFILLPTAAQLCHSVVLKILSRH